MRSAAAVARLSSRRRLRILARGFGLLLFAALIAPAGSSTNVLVPPAAAAELSVAPTCPEGNLLAGRRPVQWSDIRNPITLPTDGEVAQEGAIWDAPVAAVFDTGASTMTWDLGQPVTLNALYLQADANDKYHVWTSLDGVSYRQIGTFDEVEGVHGLRGRTLGLGGVVTRFLRVGEGVGDNFYSVSELQAFCKTPQPFPPVLKVVNSRAAVVKEKWWNDKSSRVWEMILAMLGVGLLWWGQDLEREGRPNDKLVLRERLLGVLGVLAVLTYVNFFAFHFGNFIHGWDTFHYYVGSKYFKELSYDRLYECVAVADAEDPRLRRRVELRKITNLRTNALETTAEILAHPDRCKSHFTADRWYKFKRDIAFFRGREGAKRWDDTSTDHGYNATPVWNIAGSLLANTAPASETQIYILNLLDPAYYVGMVALLVWAFGWRTASIAMLAFATNFPNRFYWTGGAFLRWDWIFYLVAGVACLKKNKPLLGGLALGYSTLLRIFPGFVFVGPIGAIVARGIEIWRRKPKGDKAGVLRELRAQPEVRSLVRFCVGAAIAAAVLLPVSVVVAGGPQAYVAFKQNTIKHKETPLTNYMGLRTVTAFRWNETGEKMKDDRLTDPWRPWKDARLRAFRQIAPVHYLIVLAFVVAIGYAGRRQEAWVTAALGSIFIAVGVELTCYYYAFIVVTALLYEKRKEVGAWLLLVTAASEFISLAPLKGMPTWLDEQYTYVSAVTLVAFAMILWAFGPGADAEERQALAAATAGPSPDAAKVGSGDGKDAKAKDTSAAAPAKVAKSDSTAKTDGSAGNRGPRPSRAKRKG